MPPEAGNMLSRPLVYTALTRARRHLSVVHAAGSGAGPRGEAHRLDPAADPAGRLLRTEMAAITAPARDPEQDELPADAG